MRASTGGTALYLAVVSNSYDAVELLLGFLADPNASTDGDTPLHQAVHLNLDEVLLRLLMARSDLERRSNEGLTPAFIAAMEGRLHLLHTLMEAKKKEL